MIVKIRIQTNTIRREIEMQDIETGCTADELLRQICAKLLDNGIKEVDNNKLFSKNNTIVTQDNLESLIVDDTLEIYYVDIVAPYGEGRHIIDKYDGLEYYFYLSEQGHLNYPHVHAKHQSKEIVINLKNLCVEKCQLNESQKNIAIKYVKKHKEYLLNEWQKWVVRR